MASFSARQEDHFQKNCPKRTFPSDFVKMGSEILYLSLAEKVSFVVLFVEIICPILAYLFFNCSSSRAEKDAIE